MSLCTVSFVLLVDVNTLTRLITTRPKHHHQPAPKTLSLVPDVCGPLRQVLVAKCPRDARVTRLQQLVQVVQRVQPLQGVRSEVLSVLRC